MRHASWPDIVGAATARDVAGTRFKDNRGHAILELQSPTKTPSTHDIVHGPSRLARVFLELFGVDSAEPDVPELAMSVVAAAEEPPFAFETPCEAPHALRCHHTLYSGRVRRRRPGTR